MAEPELRHDLTPEEERQAESYFCRKWGEPPATEELRPDGAVRPGLHEELDSVDAALKAAYAAVPQNDLFAERVLKALPVAPVPEVPSVPATTPTVLMVSGERTSRSWMWGVAGAVAALLFLVACLWLPALQNLWGKPAAQVAKGQVLDASGREVKELLAGQTYQVAGTEAVVRCGQDTSVRFLQAARFEPEAQGRGVRLHEGWAYAQSHEQNEVRVEGDDLTADVRGVSMVVQTVSRSVEPGEGLVMVFQGDALVRSSTGEQELLLKAGQMFTVALGSQVVESFMDQAVETVQELEQLPADPTELRNRRKQYREVVAGYRRELSVFEKELAATQDAGRRTELQRRQARVEEYLKQHQQRLRSFPELSDNETPRERAGRVRRAAERIERGRKEFSDPEQWL
jgi:hypothetical protein